MDTDELATTLLWLANEEPRLWECVAEWVPRPEDRTDDHVTTTREALRLLLDRG